MEAAPVIFVIEDNKVVRELLSHRIKRENECFVECFESAEAALIELEEITPDLIVLDHHLCTSTQKSMTGLDFIQSMMHNYQIPTIVFSGQWQKGVEEQFMKTGAIDYVTKGENQSLKSVISSVKNALNFIGESKSYTATLKSIEQHEKRRKLVTALLITIAAALIFNELR